MKNITQKQLSQVERPVHSLNALRIQKRKHESSPNNNSPTTNKS